MKLVTREEYEIALALAQKARSEQEILSERLSALEARLGVTPDSPTKTATKRPPKAKPKPAVRRGGAT